KGAGEIQIIDGGSLKKPKVSKLDPYAEILAAMEKMNIASSRMRAFLRDEGCRVSEATMSNFLKRLRIRRLEEDFFKHPEAVTGRIEIASNSCKVADEEFKKNPA